MTRLSVRAEHALHTYLAKVSGGLRQHTLRTLSYLRLAVGGVGREVPAVGQDARRWMVLRVMDHEMERQGVAVGERFAFMTDPGVNREWLEMLRAIIELEIDRRRGH